MASTKYATSACAVRRPSLDDLSPTRSPVTADVLARTRRGRNHRGRRRCSNSASNHWLGTESYSAERTKEPASPNTTLLDEPEVVGTLRIVGRVRCDSSDLCPNAITRGLSHFPDVRGQGTCLPASPDVEGSVLNFGDRAPEFLGNGSHYCFVLLVGTLPSISSRYFDES
jgi:hypothetical protein